MCWKDGQAVVDLQKKTGLVAMCGHTRRFNPSHQWVHKKIKAGEFNIQQMDVQTYFFRRTNMNALGQPAAGRTTCCGTTPPTPVDLFAYQAGSPIVRPTPSRARSIRRSGHCHGHEHPAQGGQRRDLHAEPELQQRRPAGHLLPLHRRHRTYIARYDDLVNGKEEKIDVSQVDVSMNGIELQDREFFAAIREGREPNASVAQVLPCYQVLHDLEQQLV